MKAFFLTSYGDFDALQYRIDVPRPVPASDEVLVKVRASAVNNTDIATRTAWYHQDRKEPGRNPELNFPRIQGAGAVGTIEEVGGDVAGLHGGQPVVIDPFLRDPSLPTHAQLLTLLGKGRDGGFAEYLTVPADYALPVDPSCGLTFAELACLPTAYQTAEEMQLRAVVAPENLVLVTGASGGVGLANVELAAMRGATVVAVAGTSKHNEIRAQGAVHLIDREADLAVELHRTVGAKQLDVVLDVVGGPSFPAMLSNLKRGGHYVTAGAIAGPLVKVDLRELIYADLRMDGQATARPEVLQNLIRYAEAGILRPRVAAVYPLAELIEAQREFLTKAHVGKIVVDVDRADIPISG